MMSEPFVKRVFCSSFQQHPQLKHRMAGGKNAISLDLLVLVMVRKHCNTHSLKLSFHYYYYNACQVPLSFFIHSFSNNPLPFLSYTFAFQVGLLMHVKITTGCSLNIVFVPYIL